MSNEFVRLNAADELFRRALRVYADVGWSVEETIEHVEELADEEGLGADPAQPYAGSGPKRPKDAA